MRQAGVVFVSDQQRQHIALSAQDFDEFQRDSGLDFVGAGEAQAFLATQCKQAAIDQR